MRLRHIFVTVLGCVAVLATSLSLFICWKDRPERLGRSRADSDWQTHSAVIYSSDIDEYLVQGQYRVNRWYDARTGLRRRQVSLGNSYVRAYNDRILQLLEEQGVPSWSVKEEIPVDEELIAALHCSSMQEIAVFPHELSPNIVLSLRTLAGKRVLNIVSKNEQCGNSTLVCPESEGIVYVGHASVRRKAIFIRVGDRWLTAFSSDGRHLVDVEWKQDD